MVRVAPIKLQYNPRTLWFDPQDLEIHKGDPVVVKTARGIEFGRATDDIIEVEEADIKKLKSELKPVTRIASPEDEAKAAEMQQKSDEALPIFKEMAAEASEDMHPVSVEYLLDGDKAVFYFEAEERVDFRELVRKLASHFHVRVDMRQIGVRDEARMVGGLGHCGQELCCKRLGGEFCPVSIRMAKEQDLSLNPQKISGVCGRLMCCLRYEFDAYKEFKSRAPKQNAMINTPEGPAKVVELDMPKELVSLRTSEGKTVKIPLAEMETSEGSARPDTVSAEVFDAYANRTVLDALTDSLLITPHFTGEDKLGDAKARKSSKGSKGRSNGSNNGSKQRKASEPASDSRKPRRRRSTTVGADGESPASGAEKQGKTSQSGQQKKRSGQRKKQGQGQNQGQGQGQNQGKGQNQSQGQRSKKQNQRQGGKGASNQGQGQGPRPGQRSSGLRNADGSQVKNTPKQQPRSQSREAGGEGAHRKTRRRSHKAGSGEGGAGGATGGSNE